MFNLILQFKEQITISQTLDKVDSVLTSRQHQLVKLDELVKSREVEHSSEVAA